MLTEVSQLHVELKGEYKDKQLGEGRWLAEGGGEVETKRIEEGGWREYVPGAKMTGPERRRKRKTRGRGKGAGRYSIVSVMAEVKEEL
ncbi:hypothetical protein E2C01_052475 [Portunus trituberculatus]|uniref:Uncharacterized protein n=1 Tax=Portunus trituberculatus TaxID=210409 RepID=A0A5B7GDU5_PORTR|nr:hypothetical protein [Portunus trituberculatus]